jgi:hypothetical protein
MFTAKVAALFFLYTILQTIFVTLKTFRYYKIVWIHLQLVSSKQYTLNWMKTIFFIQISSIMYFAFIGKNFSWYKMEMKWIAEVPESCDTIHLIHLIWKDSQTCTKRTSIKRLPVVHNKQDVHDPHCLPKSYQVFVHLKKKYQEIRVPLSSLFQRETWALRLVMKPCNLTSLHLNPHVIVVRKYMYDKFQRTMQKMFMSILIYDSTLSYPPPCMP